MGIINFIIENLMQLILFILLAIIVRKVHKKGLNPERTRELRILRDWLLPGLAFIMLICIRKAAVASRIPNHEYIGFIKLIVDTYLKVEMLLIIFTIFIGILDMLFFYKKSKSGILKRYGTILYHLLIINITMNIIGDGGMNSGVALEYLNMLLLLVITNTESDGLQDIFSKHNIDEIKGKELLAGDMPIKDAKYLFPARRVELENIINHIYNYTSDEPYVISIVGKWGEGKTGIIECIKKEFAHNNSIIWIQPMIVDSRESLVKYFFSELSTILADNGVYTGKSSHVEKYMKIVLEVVAGHSSIIDWFAASKNELKDYRAFKESLQSDINVVANKKDGKTKKILVMVDDFDRVDDDVKLSILKFIKEIADFKGLLVIFAMNLEKATEREISCEYLEKFVTKRFDLKQLDEEDIINYFLDKEIFFSEVEYDNSTLKEGMRDLKKDFLYSFKEIQSDIESSISEYNDKQNKDEDKDKNEEKKYCYNQSRIRNPRRIKKLFREIEDMYSLIEEKLKESKDNLSRQIFDDKFCSMDINGAIIRLAFVKVFYEDEFNKILIHGELGRYLDENIKSDNHEMLQNNFIVKGIFGFTKLINIYGLSNEYKDILKVLDEYFINSYTVSYLTRESKDRAKILADMIVNNTIEKNDSVGYIEFSLELIKVAIESGDSNKNEMFDNVFNYIEKMLADGVMAINKLIDGVATDKSVISCLKYSYFPLDKFKNIIDKICGFIETILIKTETLPILRIWRQKLYLGVVEF